MARMPGVRFVVPRSFTSGRPAGAPRVIVIHYTAGSEGPTAAEDGVAYDQRRTDGTSAHFYTDRNSIIQCVDTMDRSHTAKYYGNLYGVHIEQCGTQQTRAQWLDPASRETIRNTARVCAWVMKTHGIAQVRLVARQVRTGKGLGGHGDITLGFPEDGGSHMDPDGALPGSYPWAVLFEDITAALGGASGEDDEMIDFTQQSPGGGETKGKPVVELFNILIRGANSAGAAAANSTALSLKLDQIMAAIREDDEVTISPETIKALIGGVVDGVVSKLDVNIDEAQAAAIKADVFHDLTTAISNG